RIGKEDVCLYLPDDLWELNVNTGWLDEALSEMRRRIKEGKTVVLSSSWSADSLQMFGDFDFISTDTMTEPQILEILSGFKNFVIPPSELAWWAAWLAEEGGIKVAMKRWFPFNDRQIPNLLPSDWIQV